MNPPSPMHFCRCKPYTFSATRHTAPPATSCHPSTLLKIHKRTNGSGFLQLVVPKATAADSDEAPNSSSAVAPDTTLGLMGKSRPSPTCGHREGVNQAGKAVRASGLTIAQLLGHTNNTQILPTYVKPLDENTKAVD